MEYTTDYNSTYETQYATFAKYSTEYAVTVQNLLPELPLENLKANQNDIRILSVGTGDGQFDLMFIKALVENISNKSHFSYICIEPNEECNLMLNKTVENEKPEFMENVTLKTHTQKFEEFLTTWDGQKFDIIMFSHSLQQVSQKDEILPKILNELLKDHGMCIAVHASSDSGVEKFFFASMKLDKDKNEEWRDHGEKGDGCGSESIEKLVGRLQLQFKELKFDGFLDLTKCFDALSVDGNLILDLLLLTPYSRREKQGEEFQKKLDLLDSCCEVKDGRKLMKSKLTAIIMPKQ